MYAWSTPSMFGNTAAFGELHGSGHAVFQFAVDSTQIRGGDWRYNDIREYHHIFERSLAAPQSSRRSALSCQTPVVAK